MKNIDQPPQALHVLSNDEVAGIRKRFDAAGHVGSHEDMPPGLCARIEEFRRHYGYLPKIDGLPCEDCPHTL